MSKLPFGFEHRHNAYSEKDMKLGADAMSRFSSKGTLSSGAYAEDASEAYKSSAEVEAHYMKVLEGEASERHKSGALGNAAAAVAAKDGLPNGWEHGDKHRVAEALAYGASAAAMVNTAAPMSSTATAVSLHRGEPAELRLVHIATHSLEALAAALGEKLVLVSDEDRARFFAAVKRASEAVVKCR